MSGNCGECKEPINNQDKVKCLGPCDRVFHTDCLSIDVVKTRGARKEWFCDLCRKGKGTSTSSAQSNKSVSAADFTKDFLVRTLEAFKNEMFAELKANSNEFVQLRESLDMFSCKIDEATKLMEETNKRLAKVEMENQQVRERNVELQESMKDMHMRMRNIEQYSRKNNVEVSGVPTTKGEDVKSILKDVGAAVGVELKKEEVQAAHTVPTFKAERTPPLVVQFVSSATRDTRLTAYHNHRDLVASDINQSFPKRKVFVNEHLTLETKMSSTSQKHRNFVVEPMGNKEVTELAGVGKVLGTRLARQGFDKAYVVLQQFLVLKKNKVLFQNWMKATCQANAKQSADCYQCLSDWCDNFL